MTASAATETANYSEKYHESFDFPDNGDGERESQLVERIVWCLITWGEAVVDVCLMVVGLGLRV